MKIETILNQREIAENGIVQLRFAKRITNGDVVISNDWHRTLLPPGCDVDAQLAAVSSHLVEMGFPAISTGDISTVRAFCDHAWTPEVLAAYEAVQAAQKAAEEVRAKK